MVASYAANRMQGGVLNCRAPAAIHALFVFTRLSPIFFDCPNKAWKFELVNSRTYFPGGALEDAPAGVAGGAERADFGVLK